MFYVNGDSSDEGRKESIKALKRTIRIGKLAERALKNLREKGSHDASTLVVVRRAGMSWELDEDYYYYTQVYRFPAAKPIDRSDFDPGAIELKFGDVSTEFHGGVKMKSIQLYLAGAAIKFAPKLGVKTVDLPLVEMRLGTLRLKANGEVTLRPDHRFPSKEVFAIKRNYSNSEKGTFGARMLARLISQTHIQWRPHQQVMVPGHLVGLRSLIETVLIEENHIEKLINEILDYVSVFKVMDG